MPEEVTVHLVTSFLQYALSFSTLQDLYRTWIYEYGWSAERQVLKLLAIPSPLKTMEAFAAWSGQALDG